jgi:putative intracellular protease/amidase
MQIIYLAVYDGLADWETGHATAHINSPRFQREPGRFQVRTVGETTAEVTTMGGTRITPDATLAELEPAAAAMLILPGADVFGTGGNRAFTEKAREFLAAGVPVAAICGATEGLALAGVLDDRDHTGAAAMVLDATGYAGASHYRDADAVNDRGLITAGPTAPVPFAREIFAQLDLYEPEVLEAWFGLYAEGDASNWPVLAAA